MASANSTIINWHEILRYSNILFPSLFNAGDLVDYIMILLTHTIKLMRVMCDWRRISSKPQYRSKILELLTPLGTCTLRQITWILGPAGVEHRLQVAMMNKHQHQGARGHEVANTRESVM